MPLKQELIDGLITSLEGADALWAEKAAALSPGELSCRAGCFGCCVGLFAIGLPEALAIRAAVAELPAPARAELRARAKRAVERSAPTFPGDSAQGILDPERSEGAEDSWLLAVRGVPCPALELPAGRCAVYAARPTTCRTYGLALRSRDAVLVPACELNLAGASDGRILETGIDAGRLGAVDQSLCELAAEAGLPAGAETTVAHALVGTAFAPLERGD
jgi:Fe-S-cluster containining protein